MHKNYQPIEKILRYLFVTFIAVAGCMITIAQVRFTTVINDRQPEISGYVQVEYTVENAKSIRGIAPPSFRNFRVIQGPVQSNGLSYMNGVLSHSKSVSLILQPLATGKLLVPGATAFIDGKMMRSEAVVIEVKHAGARSNAATPPVWPGEEKKVDEEYVLRQGESVVEKIKDNLLVKADVNKTTCYVGEPITATFTLCSRLNSESRVLKRPSLNGFSVYDMIEPEANTPSVQNINGKYYNVHIIRKTQLFPLQQGSFVIDPVELDNKVRFLKKGEDEAAPKNKMQQLLDEFIVDEASSEIEHTFTLASKPVTITVNALPTENIPEGFNGAVGRFGMSAKWTTEPRTAGDAFNLQVQIKGEGNFSVINPPVLALPPGLEAYEPVVKENVDKSIYPLSGTKTFDYTFIARDTGMYALPAVRFSYFDPSDAQYKTERSDSFNIHIVASDIKKVYAKEIAAPLYSAKPAEWIKDIPISALILSLAIIFFAGLGIYEGRRKRRQRKARKSRGTSSDSAPINDVSTVIAEPFEEARIALREERSDPFYKHVNSAIWATLSEKLNIASTELNKQNAINRLIIKGADEHIIHELNTVLHECEMALYTPGHTVADMEQTLKKAERVIAYLQSSTT